LFEYLEVPLNCESWVNEERLVIVSVVDEVVAKLNLGTNAEVVGDVIPELRLREEYQLTMTISILTTPQIKETREGALVVSEVKTPYTCELNRVVSRCIVVALEVTLVHQLSTPGL
jgi:hypothetical protein